MIIAGNSLLSLFFFARKLSGDEIFVNEVKTVLRHSLSMMYRRFAKVGNVLQLFVAYGNVV